MVLLARLFPASRMGGNASRIPGRRRPKSSPRATPVAIRAAFLAAEPLEPRALLAVTADLVGADLQITLGAADDVAYLSNDGSNYIVRGTGLSGFSASIASVNSVAVAGTAAANQSFNVAAGVAAVLVDPLTVAASVESTTVAGAIDTIGDVLVNSPAITLAANVTTTGQHRYRGAVGLVGERTLSAGASDVVFESTVDSSPAVFADPDAFAAGTTLTSAFPGITLSTAGTSDADAFVKSGQSGVSTPTTGDYAPTGNRIFSGLSSEWNAPGNVFKAAFASPVASVSLDFAPNDNDDPNAYLEAYDSSGNKVASATYPPPIPELSFVTLTVSAPSIAYVLASFDPTGINTGLLDNLRATYTTTPSAALTVNAAGATTFSAAVGGGTALASLTTNVGGTVSLKSVTTSGAQSYGDDATLDGTYTTTDSAFSVAGITSLAGNTIVSTGSGPISFTGALDGTKTLGLTAGTGSVTFTGLVGDTTPLGAITINSATNVTANGIRAASLTQVAGSGTTTLNGGAFTSAPAGTEAVRTSGAAGISLTGTNLAANGAMTTTNSGPVTFNQSGTIAVAAAGDILADGAVSLTATGGITTAGDVTTTDDNVTFASKTTLSGPVAVNTGAGAGNILFSSTIDGAQTLGLTAGTGSITFTGAVGGGTRLGAISIESATNVTASAITAASLSQAAGSGTTTLNGAVNTNATAGVSLTGTNLAVNAGITTTNSGTVTFNQKSGTIAVAAAGDILADGAVSLTATGGITTAGDVTTTDDNVTFASKTTLSGPVAVNTGAGAGNILFSSTIDGAQTLGLTAGTGSITFTGAVGGGTPLAGISLTSAASVTAASTLSLDGTSALATDGITIDADVNKVSLAETGSSIVNFSGNGIWFKGGSTDSIISGFMIEANGAYGVRFEAGDYTGTVLEGNQISGNTAAGIHLAGAEGLISLGRLVITAPGLGGTPLTTSAAAELFLPGVTSSSIQAINAAGYPGASLGFVSLGASVAGTPPTALSGAGGIGGISEPGLTYQAAAQTAFETNPLLPGTNGRAGTAAYDATSSGTLPNGGAQDAFLFYDFLVSGGAGVLNLLIADNLVASNGSDGIEAAVGDHAGTVITANTIRDNGDPTTHVGNGILVEGSNLTIGWTATAGQPNTVSNTITGNAANGIEIRGAAAQNNTILSNSIYLNGHVTFDAGEATVVGEGIALTDGGNEAMPSPQILGAVADTGSGTVRVRVFVPAAGSYYVQLFANTAADERGVAPVDVNGFEGRSYVGDSPAQSGSPVTTGKPAIAGMLVTGNTVAVIEMPADRVPAGGWITATATAVESGVAGATSGFSAAVQLPSAPVLAVGSDGPAVWVPHYTYQALSGNVLRLGGLTVTEVNRLVAMRGRQIFVSGNGRSEVATATVASVRRIGGRAVNMVLRNITSPEGSLAGTAGRLEPGPLTLPTARLYDAATGEVVLDVGAEAIAASLEAAGVTPGAAAAFTSRFQGGLRVASGDVNGDGFAELLTAPGVSPAIPAATFGTATRIITIYNGDKAAGWQSVSLDVSGAFPGYSGGFQVTLGDVLPEVPGSGSGVLELIVAGTNKVAVYELTVPGRGAAPVIAATPAAIWTVGPRFRITGLAAGDFSAAASDEVVVATAAPAGTFVRTFTLADGGFTTQSSFWAWSYVEGDPQRRLRDVFANGASLAVGDIDGAPDGKPELVLAAGSQGLANFRVLANDLVATGSQAAINQALSMGRGFTQRSRPQFTTVNGRQVWQPAGGPDYFVGVPRLTNAVARGINAPLSVAVVNARGTTAAGQVFAALGPQNATSNMVRRLAWSSLEASWSGTDAFQAQPAGRTRFPLGGGVLLG
jgi:hypothetical protein